MAQAGGLGKIFSAYTNEVEFLFVYIAEAHPNQNNPQPKTIEERLKNAVDLRDKKKWPLPIIVDDMKNSAMDTYGAWPARAVFVGKFLPSYCHGGRQEVAPVLIGATQDQAARFFLSETKHDVR